MAAIAAPSFAIDPVKAAKYPVLIGDHLRDTGKARKQNALIQCSVNHKPNLSGVPNKTTITPSQSKSGNNYDLCVKVDEDGNNYFYSGTQQPSEAYALIYEPVSQTLILDKIGTGFTFNLRATPDDKNSKSLDAQFPYLPTADSRPDGLFDDANDPSTGADINNPYDYRHFLKRRRTSSPEPLFPSTALVAPAASPPRRVPTRLKPKPRPYRPQQQPKRAPSPPPAREEADADNEDSDPDALTIEMEPDTRRRAFKPAFTHDIRNGPISLRSAASSVSPAPEAEQSSESDEDVEELQLAEAEAVEEAAEDEEEDEEMDMAGGGRGAALTPGEQKEDDDDDERSLEAELEQALESQADEEDGGVRVYGNGVAVNGLGVNGVRMEMETSRVVVDDESSSESEEE